MILSNISLQIYLILVKMNVKIIINKIQLIHGLQTLPKYTYKTIMHKAHQNSS